MVELARDRGTQRLTIPKIRPSKGKPGALVARSYNLRGPKRALSPCELVFATVTSKLLRNGLTSCEFAFDEKGFP